MSARPASPNQTPKRGKDPKQRFRPGMAIERSGIYEAFHATHRITHEVTLLEGQKFPPCSRCKDKVSFELVKAIPTLNASNSPIVYVIGVFIPEAAA